MRAPKHPHIFCFPLERVLETKYGEGTHIPRIREEDSVGVVGADGHGEDAGDAD